MPKRTFWLATGVAIGAGSSLWAERKVRRSVHEATARLQPDAVVLEVGRSARLVADSAGTRVRDAVASGRHEMQRREEELWSELAGQGVEVPLPPRHPAPTGITTPAPIPAAATSRPATAPGTGTPTGRRKRRTRTGAQRRAKSPSHLDK